MFRPILTASLLYHVWFLILWLLLPILPLALLPYRHPSLLTDCHLSLLPGGCLTPLLLECCPVGNMVLITDNYFSGVVFMSLGIIKDSLILVYEFLSLIQNFLLLLIHEKLKLSLFHMPLLLVLFLILSKWMFQVLCFYFLPIHSCELVTMVHYFGLTVVPIHVPEG